MNTGSAYSVYLLDFRNFGQSCAPESLSTEIFLASWIFITMRYICLHDTVEFNLQYSRGRGEDIKSRDALSHIKSVQKTVSKRISSPAGCMV